jgi:menaquinone-dependent protoporphyrinogen IX oxidase
MAIGEIMMNEEKKTLIAYVSRGGVTKEYANIISEVLKDRFGHAVDIVDLRKNKSPNTSKYDNIIIGTGVRIGKVYREGLRFLKNDFGERKVAVFLSSNEAGTPESYQDAVVKYLNPIKENYRHLNLLEIEGFGGRIKVLGKTSVDLRNPEKVLKWAESLGEKFITNTASECEV